jgi:hypothetical protein
MYMASGIPEHSRTFSAQVIVPKARAYFEALLRRLIKDHIQHRKFGD